MIIFYLLYNWMQFIDVVLTIRGLCIVLSWCLGRSITEHTFFRFTGRRNVIYISSIWINNFVIIRFILSLFNVREAHGFRWNHHGFSGIDSVFTYGAVFKCGELCARGRNQGQGQVVASQRYYIYHIFVHAQPWIPGGEKSIHGCYSLVNIPFTLICACKNNRCHNARTIWRHNASNLHSRDVTDQLW